MRGPHEGKELELMLAGKKFLAAFGDFIPESGKIHEKIIPEKKFAPYIKNGTFVRIERYSLIHYKNKDCPVKDVCFVVPGHEWRAEAFLWLSQGRRMGLFAHDDAVSIIVGRLLGYNEEDIEDFITFYPAVGGFKMITSSSSSP